MVNGLDVAPVWIESEGSIISGVVFGAEARPAVVPAAGSHCCSMKEVDGLAIRCSECNMKPTGNGSVAAQPEIREAIVAVTGHANSTCLVATFHQALDPKGS
ncbi:MAG: hypothetical protein AVDCRST_MAG23-1424 [uncultured Sphingosinicella sp.]|uniref:Uncharacterized protein n=1 Tax=uncultured Sphingosinicella sp. TaxID=478748 RepID=A0A6J4TZK6_9SPHN|nr:MAG: hypothetical protein AVDCRST_MAG23-1424 [uncultured Sphingosinicella sp.]